MRPFKFTRARDAATAVRSVAANSAARFVAGGTNLVDLMREGVENPAELVDISTIALTQIRAADGGVSIGALAKNTETANHALIRENYPMLTQAILAGASGQIRNMASNGGNLLQRTRCPYFYDTAMACNKREPGSGCSAMHGVNRMHAVFGWSDKCVAVNPSDMCVALAALDAKVRVQGTDGKERVVSFNDLHRLPGDTPDKDHTLAHGEMITAIDLPKSDLAAHSYYLKVRDRASYAFALVSVAACLSMKGNTITDARIALGGVAHKPWRALEAERALKGKAATEQNFAAAADAEMLAAKPLEHNKFKVELGKRAIVLALRRAAKG